jgi:hypothetical protein
MPSALFGVKSRRWSREVGDEGGAFGVGSERVSAMTAATHIAVDRFIIVAHDQGEHAD